MKKFIIVLILLLTSISSTSQNSEDYLVYETTVYNIVDGDTFDGLVYVGFSITIDERFRVLGINTWETRTRDLEEKEKGFLAKARAEELLLNKKVTVWIPKNRETGSFGRYLAYVILPDGRYYHTVMSEEGHNKVR